MRWVVSATLVVAAAACERVVTVAVPDTPPRLVVEARLERLRSAVSGTQRIRLTTTDRYFSSAAPPPARGAVVRVVDDSGRVVPFGELASEPGTYATTTFVINVGRTYTLQITYAGQEYRSTETATSGVAIDSLWFIERIANLSPREGLRATIGLRDPVGVKNFYLWEQYVDGRRIVRPDSLGYYRVVASDDFSDGTRIRRYQPYDGVIVRSGQQVRVQQVAISEQAFRYYNALSEQGLNDGSPFGVPPSSLRGNVANLTNPSSQALGYFIVAEVTEVAGTVP
jgi:Domain of unknown function (DUF4249)